MCLPLYETCQRVCGVMGVESERRQPSPGCRDNRSLSFSLYGPYPTSNRVNIQCRAVNEQTWPLYY